MANDLIQELKHASELVFSEVVQIREHLHQYPELSFQEYKTADFIAAVLDKHGIEYTKGVAGTGIVGVLSGVSAGKTIALRADIDALPILEQNKVPYASKNIGVMHACGHDVHTASLLGTLIVLAKFKHRFSGNIKFLFQPGEEQLPGGASLLIKEGVLTAPDVECISAQHVFPELEAGKVGFRSGMYMASTDELYLTVKGVGGHGAMPHKCVDAILVAAEIISGLQNIVSRRANPITPSVLSFGKIEGLGATNVLPSQVAIEGTFRTFDEDWRAQAHKLIKQQAEGIANAYGANCEVDIRHGYPFLRNDERLTELSKNAAIAYLGAANVIDLPIRTTAEDFAFYSQLVPACFYRLGVANKEKGIEYGVHHPLFDADIEAFKTSVGLMAYIAIKQLEA